MKQLSYSHFYKHLSESLKAVNDEEELLLVSCPDGKNVVVMAEDEFNSIQETLYLSSNAANHKRLSDAIAELNRGVVVKKSK